jgi:hypothetical protein
MLPRQMDSRLSGISNFWKNSFRACPQIFKPLKTAVGMDSFYSFDLIEFVQSVQPANIFASIPCFFGKVLVTTL